MANKFVTEQNKIIFEEYKRTGIKPTHLFCSKCSNKKLLTDMTKNTKNELGVACICLGCNAEHMRQYTEKNKDTINEKARAKHATPEYIEQSWAEHLEKLPEPLRKNKIIRKECEETGKEPTHKHCNKCGELLPLESYSVSRSPEAIFQRDSICKICQKKKRNNLSENDTVELGSVLKQNLEVKDRNNALEKMYNETGISPTHKFCNTCEQMVNIDNFHINAKLQFGRVSRCKDCEKKHKAEYYLMKKKTEK